METPILKGKKGGLDPTHLLDDFTLLDFQFFPLSGPCLSYYFFAILMHHAMFFFQFSFHIFALNLKLPTVKLTKEKEK